MSRSEQIVRAKRIKSYLTPNSLCIIVMCSSCSTVATAQLAAVTDTIRGEEGNLTDLCVLLGGG